ncbi:GNAT family N-acetyltransferase [Altererythrobacter lutimaris]|uniref:GNAT family N-acetyltransferase n=1 Tax=Altererythrobacter lutimaris TaxID=2743979 RepID=A0A850HCT1_9SPHN|nr:GNAT family N-acetyltransferase [Altererythrobacter lutimaris]
MIDIAQAHSGDWPAIARFVERCYGASARYKGEARWRWQMEQAPYPMASASHPPSWIAHDGAEVVGQISLQPGRLWLSGEPLDIGWIVDVMIDERYRGKGLGHRLYGAILDAGHVAVTLTMAPATRQIAMRAGSVELPPVAQLLRAQNLSQATIRRWAEHSAEAGGRAGRIRHVTPVAKAVLDLVSIMSKPRSQNPDLVSKVHAVDRVDKRDLEQWQERIQSGALTGFDRSDAFWRWRFENAPDLDYRFAKLSGDGKARGIMAWREPLSCELPVGTIADVLCDPEDGEGMEALLHYGLSELQHCEAVIAGASTECEITAYRKAGFKPVKWHRPTVSARDTAVLEKIESASQWRMTKADHDWDQVHPC